MPTVEGRVVTASTAGLEEGEGVGGVGGVGGGVDVDVVPLFRTLIPLMPPPPLLLLPTVAPTDLEKADTLVVRARMRCVWECCCCCWPHPVPAAARLLQKLTEPSNRRLRHWLRYGVQLPLLLPFMLKASELNFMLAGCCALK